MELASHDYETLDSYNKEYETVDLPDNHPQQPGAYRNETSAMTSTPEDYELPMTQCPAYGTRRISTQHRGSHVTSTTRPTEQTSDATSL